MLTAKNAYSDLTLTAALRESVMESVLSAGGGSTTAKGTGHTSSSSAVDEPSSVPPPIALSPDALMAYCQSRINSIDSQSNQIMQQQQKNQNETTTVDNLASLLNDIPAGSGTPPTVSIPKTQWQQIQSAYVAAAKQCPDIPTLEQDRAAFANMDTHSGPSDEVHLDVSNLPQLTQNLKNDASNLNSGSEMIMINLQSLMSQRQTAIQLTTNLVQALGDQSNSIAKNIGQ